VTEKGLNYNYILSKLCVVAYSFLLKRVLTLTAHLLFIFRDECYIQAIPNNIIAFEIYAVSLWVVALVNAVKTIWVCVVCLCRYTDTLHSAARTVRTAYSNY
jgi:hypothetical protein